MTSPEAYTDLCTVVRTLSPTDASREEAIASPRSDVASVSLTSGSTPVSPTAVLESSLQPIGLTNEEFELTKDT